MRIFALLFIFQIVWSCNNTSKLSSRSKTIRSERRWWTFCPINFATWFQYLKKDQHLQYMAPSHLMKLFDETARFNALLRASRSKKKDRFNYYSKPMWRFNYRYIKYNDFYWTPNMPQKLTKGMDKKHQLAWCRVILQDNIFCPMSLNFKGKYLVESWSHRFPNMVVAVLAQHSERWW